MGQSRKISRFTCISRALLLVMLSLACAVTPSRGAEPAGSREPLVWRQLAPLPDSPGLAGSFAGVSNSALIVAGGTNFLGGDPWAGGKKAYHDTIYVLEKPDGEWKTVEAKLPRPLAYGVSISARQGLICIGGNDPDRSYADVFALQWDGQSIRTSPLPPLPAATASACGALIGDTIYFATGTLEAGADKAAATMHFWALDLASPQPQWIELEGWPGPDRFNAVAAVQDGSFFLISGMHRAVGADGKTRIEYLTDAYRYTPAKAKQAARWTRIADLPRPNAAAPSPAPALGQSHILLLGGAATGKGADLPLKDRPSFLTESLAYHTITDTWAPLARTPAPRVATPVVAWGKLLVVPTGESKPGVRSPEIWAAQPNELRSGFGVINYFTIIVYLLAMVGIGVYFSTRNRTTDDFFRGGQRIPWWAAGLSIFATLLSSITFMAVPAASYGGGWNVFIAASAALALTPLVIYAYLPFFRSLDVTSAYEYLERRFNLGARWLASLLFIAFQIGRIAIVLYLPSLALATVSNINIELCILIMGVLCIVYTVMGGIEAVIWTDVAQAVILAGGAVFSLVLIIARVEGGIPQIVQAANDSGKFFQTVSWSWDYTLATGWVMIVGSLFSNLLMYTASQDVVQRYVTTKDEKTAARALWTNAAVSLPASALFFAIGTALFAYYKFHPRQLDPMLPTDSIFPQFIVRELPVGIAGVVVAGIFAAAQSTLASSLNSVATAYVTDFHKRLRPASSDLACLRLARWITVVVGVFGTGFALLLASSNVQSLYLSFLEIVSLLGGALSGLFVLGIFTRRTSGAGALVGVVVGSAATVLAKYFTDTNFFLYAVIGVVGCVVPAYLISLIFPANPRDLSGLTIFTRTKSPESTVEQPALAATGSA